MTQHRIEQQYETTSEPAVTPTDGAAAWLIECTCATHPEGMRRAIVRSSGEVMPKDRIHGTVTLAHSPAGRLAERMRTANVWRA